MLVKKRHVQSKLFFESAISSPAGERDYVTQHGEVSNTGKDVVRGG